MAHINLLPWREERRQERQQQFIASLVAGLIFAVVVLYGAILYADSLLDDQNGRNTFLQTEINLLDIKIAEIRTLDEEREQLLARMNVIQELQTSRPKVVKVFEALVHSVPEGIHLEKVARQGDSLTIDGIAQSNARVSVFMRNLDEDNEFDNPDLTVIKRTSTKDDAIRKFTLVSKESKITVEEGDK
jgi:type IV pilus assembly protein PilN